MAERVIPEPKEEKPDPLLLGDKSTWALYGPSGLWDEIKRCAKVDGYSSASTYAVALLVFALRRREAERIADRKK
jgi:hypothetical protein